MDYEKMWNELKEIYKRKAIGRSSDEPLFDIGYVYMAYIEDKERNKFKNSYPIFSTPLSVVAEAMYNCTLNELEENCDMTLGRIQDMMDRIDIWQDRGYTHLLYDEGKWYTEDVKNDRTLPSDYYQKLWNYLREKITAPVREAVERGTDESDIEESDVEDYDLEGIIGLLRAHKNFIPESDIAIRFLETKNYYYDLLVYEDHNWKLTNQAGEVYVLSRKEYAYPNVNIALDALRENILKPNFVD